MATYQVEMNFAGIVIYNDGAQSPTSIVGKRMWDVAHEMAALGTGEDDTCIVVDLATGRPVLKLEHNIASHGDQGWCAAE